MNRTMEKKPVDWLLEPDDIGVRYLALRDLIDADTKELATAKKQAHEKGQIAQVLSNMKKKGTGKNREQDTIPNTLERCGRLSY